MLAEHALDKLAPYFPGIKPAWTRHTPLSGSDFGGVARMEARNAFFGSHPQLAEAVLRPIFRRHGTHSQAVVGDGNLGEDFGAGLTERELRYFVEREWAQTADDVLWRRTKAGLLMTPAQRARVAQALGGQ
jgi:glycerol-3-phosphate dehydrogenase